jgi:epoxyqueuosine reductase
LTEGHVRRRGALGRAGLRAGHHLEHRLIPAMSRAMTPRRLRQIRDLPGPALSRPLAVAPPWAAARADPPGELATVAGIRRDDAAESAAFAAQPLHDWFKTHPEAVRWMAPHYWRSFLPVARRLLRARRAIHYTERHNPPPGPVAVDPGQLTSRLREEARRLGISAVGVAPYDPRFTFAEYAGRNAGDRMIICVLEQPWGATQELPCAGTEKVALGTYAALLERMTRLTGWLQEQGFQARAEDYEGESVYIHYAVAAGLGQLGLNGQLLTPQAGSRCRLAGITTSAPLVFDAPKDYGIEGVCDQCQVCVRRCPVGAIPAVRREYRGVTKAKLNTKRCFPIVTQVEGCAICMKVCPVQRFGLDVVLTEFRASGRILGKDTDELEGYDWPVDGRHYRPGERPRIGDELLAPAGLAFDPRRLAPPGAGSPSPGAGSPSPGPASPSPGSASPSPGSI